MTVLEVETPLGPSRFTVDGPLDADCLLVLGHGAGGGIETPDLMALAGRLPALGPTCVARFEQPWRVAGKRVAPAPARLDEAWLAALPALLDRARPRRVVLGGRSAGARVACRTAGSAGADAVLALAFPLHPPGRPEKSRAAELLGAGVPAVVVQGTRDPFGGVDELVAVAGAHPDIEVVAVDGAAHELTVPKRVGDTGALWEALSVRVAGWLAGLPPAAGGLRP